MIHVFFNLSIILIHELLIVQDIGSSHSLVSLWSSFLTTSPSVLSYLDISFLKFCFTYMTPLLSNSTMHVFPISKAKTQQWKNNESLSVTGTGKCCKAKIVLHTYITHFLININNACLTKNKRRKLETWRRSGYQMHKHQCSWAPTRFFSLTQFRGGA